MRAKRPPVGRPVEDDPFGPVERIAVLCSTGLGDFIFALPALAALRARFPRAQIALLGRPWHQEFLNGRTPLVDEVIVLPPVPGVGAPPDAPCDQRAIEACCAALRHHRFDLAFQLFGGGRYSNPFVRRLGARHSFGLCAPGAEPLEHSLPYVHWQNERLRLLEVVGLAGAHGTELDPRLPVLARDRAELSSRVDLPPGPLAVLGPGATDPRRRWPAERFAAVGDALAKAGASVVVAGDERERELAAVVVGAMRHPALDLGGVLSLGGLAALLERSTLVVANDSGPLHLAQAVGAATVGLYWISNLFLAAPPKVARHRHLLSCRLECPVCGAENLKYRCPHDPSFIADITVDEVSEAALALWRQEVPRGVQDPPDG